MALPAANTDNHTVKRLLETILIEQAMDQDTNKNPLEDAFQRLATGTAAVTGVEFCRALVKELARALGFKFALVAELTDARMEKVRTLAFWDGNGHAKDFEYNLNGTPCENVMRGHLCFYGSGVAAQFPEDRILITMGVESYIGVPLRDSNGEPIGVLAALHTEPIADCEKVRRIFQVFASRAGVELERLRMQRLLSASEERFRSLLESGTDLILTVDRDGRIQYASPSCARVAGYGPEEIVGRLAFEFILPEDRAVMLDMLCNAIQRPEPGPLFETKIRHKNGTWIDVESRANQIYLAPHTPGLVINCRDVSERKKTEAHVRFQKTLLETQSECSLEGLLVISNDGKSLHSNRRFTEVWKLPADAVIAAAADDIWEKIAPLFAAPERVMLRIKELADDPRGTLHATCRLRDGRSIECYSAPVLHKSGACFGRLWSCRDVTEQVRLYEQVRHSQRLESIGVVSAGIAHEFKNILGPILGNAELASMDIPPDHRASKCLRQIIKSTQAARDLVQQILTFGRQAPLAQSVVSLGDVVTDAVRMLRVAIPKTVEISRHISPDLPRVMADPNQIHQIMINLGINAWQAMDKGNGQIAIALDLVDGSDAADEELPDGKYLRLMISDTGRGMDAEILSRLFEPFFTTKAPGEGTGLGLAVVHGIVKSHNGVIQVSSSPGVGTAFRIYLPPFNETKQTEL
jgi:PAS domain S-box-containing protein